MNVNLGIAMITRGGVEPETTIALASMCIKLGQYARDRGMQISLINKDQATCSVGRSVCVDVAAHYKCSHLLFVDDDVVFPPDTAMRLLTAMEVLKAGIVGGCYVQRDGRGLPHGIPLEGTPPIDLSKKGYLRMRAVPGGCTLFDMRVFDKLERPYFRELYANGGTLSEDTIICARAIKDGWSVYADLDLSRELIHVGRFGCRWEGAPAEREIPTPAKRGGTQPLPGVIVPAEGIAPEKVEV